ncbi:DNA-binding transcriptional MerR regulator [Allonocardiopsis opalescens]|uniref:DNA-binding transcriptional MerR regulator n=2 Tax=Allonocardiopsis opalescens TaxID=1144618 RepID=A0A2T0QEN4_9ACTN|nr:DNA-binding transcriptional MerR regulator [Allonocardiopsis opalescens]
MGGAEEGLRPVDLARLAGVSTQQIRNYVDAGVLPPVRWTPGGHRRFGPRHRAALLAYRALARGFGWEAAQDVMRAVHSGEVAAALEVVDAGHHALHEERLALIATAAALEAVAGEVPEGAGADVPPRSGLLVGAVAARLGVRASVLRMWESAGLLRPRRDPATGYRRYGPADVRDARMVDMLRRNRYPLTRIRPVLDGLRRTGGSEELRAAVAERRDALAQRATAMLAAAARLHRYLAGEPDGAGPDLPEQDGADGPPPDPGWCRPA